MAKSRKRPSPPIRRALMFVGADQFLESFLDLQFLSFILTRYLPLATLFLNHKPGLETPPAPKNQQKTLVLFFKLKIQSNLLSYPQISGNEKRA